MEIQTSRKSRSDNSEKKNYRDDGRSDRRGKRKKKSATPSIEMDTYKIQVGSSDGAEPRNIVGAIANEVELDSKYIGSIEIFDKYSTVDLPKDMPNDILNMLQKVVVSGKRLNISILKKEQSEKRRDKTQRKNITKSKSKRKSKYKER